MRAFFARLRDVFRRRALARQFEEEMAFHLAGLEREAIERGESAEQAHLTALRAFGNATRAREDLRERAGFAVVDEWLNDVRHACRGLLRRRSLSASIILILTLGLGAAATIHGLINAVFLRPLPVPHSEQLFAVVSSDKHTRDRVSRGTVRRLEASLPPRSVAAYNGGSRCTVQVGPEPAFRASVRAVNGDFFGALAMNAAAGRLLTPADDVPGQPTRVVVASYGWAKTHFGSAEAALGREILANRVPVAIVGVLPEAFTDVSVGRVTELWFATALQPQVHLDGNASIHGEDDRPIDADWNRDERVAWLEVLVRSRADAPASAGLVNRAWETERNELRSGPTDPREREALDHTTLFLEPAPGGRSRFRDDFHTTGWLLTGVVGILLVLVCTNVSGLLLVRAMSRHREIGVRLSLGAGAFRVLRLGVIEAALLSTCGAAAGYGVASVLLPIAARLLAPGQTLDLSLGWKSMLVMGGLAMLCAILSSLGPAFWTARLQPLAALTGNRGLGRAPVRLGRLLVVAQFAMAVALVALAVSFAKELKRSLAAEQGFVRDQVLTATFDPAGAGYHESDMPSLLGRLRSTALAIPGVKNVSFAYNGILIGSIWSSGISFRDPAAHANQRSFQQDAVFPGYFATTGTPLLAGREFQTIDTVNTQPVAIVNATFAREVFGDVSPLGHVFGDSQTPSKDDWTIVGVVADVHVNGVREPVRPMFYTSALQANSGQIQFLAVRFEGSEAAVLPGLRSALSGVDPGLVFRGWHTLEELMTEDVGRDMAATQITALFGGCALLLAATGVAGSLGYIVTLRQRDVALRMALGADPARVLSEVLADALRLCVYGGVIGVLLVWTVPMLPVVRAMLYRPPETGAAVIALLVAMVAAVAAGWIPARRAARIDPMLTLKAD